jgi:tetratricopeptide (TPR) repeat protein
MYYICNAIDHVKDDSTVPDHVKYDLYYFRSTLQLLVKNYGYAIDDLKYALFFNENDESYYLLINCYIALEAYEKALQIIDKRIKKLEELKTLNNIKFYQKKEKEVKALHAELIDKLNKIEVFKNMSNEKQLKLYDELTKRGIKIKPQIHNIPPNYEAFIHLEEDNYFHFPILIIYEEFNTTDYIQNVSETAFISDILEIILGQDKLPWDKENKYNTNTCVGFSEVSEYDSILKQQSSYYYPLKNDDRLIDVLTNKKVHMNGLPVIVVLSQLSNFYPHFLKSKVIIKRK